MDECDAFSSEQDRPPLQLKSTAPTFTTSTNDDNQYSIRKNMLEPTVSSPIHEPADSSTSVLQATSPRKFMGAVATAPRPLDASPSSPTTLHQTGSQQEDEIFIDEFGFELTDPEQVQQEKRYIRNIDGQKVARHEVKWSKMVESWNQSLAENFDKMKSRARKGLPSRMRGSLWQLLSGAREQMESAENRTVYQALLNKPLKDEEVKGLIERDLNRTFPTHSLFHDADGVGQQKLKNVLHCYCLIDPEVSYVQGMGFIVGTLLTQMEEEEAFWCFHALMHSETYRCRELFRSGFPMLMMFFYQLKRLIQTLIPKLWAHLDECNVDLSFFASQWFLTLFVYHFPFRTVVRVWDIFFTEGWKIVFRVAIALLKWNEKELLTLAFEELMQRMKTLHEGKGDDEIVARALKIKFKTETLLLYRREFEAGKR